MKNINKILILVFLCLVETISFAQYSCTGGRFFNETFTVAIASDIIYGSAKTVSGSTQTLKLDIYTPVGDTSTKRPLLIFGHGGSFISGTKADGDVVALCNRFAKRGYVCVSYDYRLGIGLPIDQAHASKAVFRATQDAKAVVRFFKKDAQTTNTYKVDPGYVYLGGSSAGAFIALHYAYLDQEPEIPAYLDTVGLGPIEGSSGNPGFNSDISAVINLCGALGSVNWMHAGDEPVCSMHGTIDQVVPYATALLLISGTFPIMVVDGSHTVDSMATVLSLDHVFHTWIGADHVPYASSTTYMDSTVEFVRDFLCTQLGKAPLPGTLVQPIQQTVNNIKIYPTVSSSEIIIEKSTDEKILVEITDVTGRVLKKLVINDRLIPVSRDNISNGLYLLTISGKNFRETEKIVFY